VSASPITLALSPEALEAIVEAVTERVAERLEAAEDDPWMGVEQVARYLDCPTSRVYALVSARRIPHERDHTRLMFKRTEIDAWVRAGGGKRP
jgi:excisionase family DNA binding protein